MSLVGEWCESTEHSRHQVGSIPTLPQPFKTETMKPIIFGDQESIEYARAKGIEKLKSFKQHECDCEFCENDEYECPHCQSNEEPDWDENDRRLCRCSDCGAQCFRTDYDKFKNYSIIEKFEK